MPSAIQTGPPTTKLWKSRALLLPNCAALVNLAFVYYLANDSRRHHMQIDLMEWPMRPEVGRRSAAA